MSSNELLPLRKNMRTGSGRLSPGKNISVRNIRLLPLGEIRKDYWEYGAEVTMSAYFTYQWMYTEDEDYRVLPTREEFEELLTLWEQGARKREELAAV